MHITMADILNALRHATAEQRVEFWRLVGRNMTLADIGLIKMEAMEQLKGEPSKP